MRISVELSLYPLRDDPIPAILAFIDGLVSGDDVEVVVNQMSTQLRGELNAVMRCVHGALERSFASAGPQVLVAKFLNSDLPIGTPPDLDDAG
ncbi:MAG TPA: hypothetical protein VLD39_10010 [Gammaproteobacteria bacterium]|nr:hypothetical protein [Gammaproteobacteria bacterium]